jgi:hypothetical protein
MFEIWALHHILIDDLARLIAGCWVKLKFANLLVAWHHLHQPRSGLRVHQHVLAYRDYHDYYLHDGEYYIGIVKISASAREMIWKLNEARGFNLLTY